MAQKLRDDKIGTLSHSGGAIIVSASSFVPSWLTIGGQQYKVTSSLSRTITTDITMAANTLYMVYAVRSAGNTELRISANVNSVGPSGFVSWKLISAFYANGNASVAFGTFINIDGAPISNTWDGAGIDIESGGVNLVKGTVGTDRYTCMRVGDKLEFAFIFYKTVADGSATVGGFAVKPPAALLVDGLKMATNGGENFRNRNSGHLTTAGDGRIGTFTWGGSGEFGFQFANGSTNSQATTATHPFPGTFWSWQGLIVMPITGWSNTPLKDL